MHGLESKPALELTLIGEDDDPFKWEGIVHPRDGAPAFLDLSTIGWKDSLRSLLILMLLAKAQGDDADEKRLTFWARHKNENWISSLAGRLHSQSDGKTKFEEDLKLKPFVKRSSRTLSDDSLLWAVTYLQAGLPLKNLKFSKKAKGDTGSEPIPVGELVGLALRLEKKHTPWTHREVPEIKRKLEMLKKVGNQKNSPAIPPSKNTERKLIPRELLDEFLYYLRLSDGWYACIDLLIKHRDDFPELCNHALPTGELPLLLAIGFQRNDLVEHLLSLENIDVNKANYYKVTPLLKAASRNDTDLIERLISMKANPMACNKQGANVIHEAAFGASLSAGTIIKRFTEHGVDCNVISQDGFTPLAVAISRRCPQDAIEFLIKRAEENNALGAKDRHHETVIYKAFKYGDFRTMIDLISRMQARGDSWTGLPSREPRGSPLFQAVLRRDLEYVKHLKEQESGSFDINYGDPYFDRTPLHEAVEKKHLEMVRLLLHYEADPFRPDNHGKTPRELLPFDKTFDDFEIETELKNHEQIHNHELSR